MNLLERETVENFLSSLTDTKEGVFFKKFMEEIIQLDVMNIFIAAYENKENEGEVLPVIKDIWREFRLDELKYDVHYFSAMSLLYNFIFSLFLHNSECIKSRIDKDLLVLLEAKPSLVYVDAFGDIDTSNWVVEIKNYIYSKVLPLVNRYTFDNLENIASLIKRLGFNFYTDDNFIINDSNRHVGRVLESCLLDDAAPVYIDALVKRKENAAREEMGWLREGSLVTNNSEDSIESDQSECFKSMSGREYEAYLINRINNETVFHAEGTIGSGDQGGDIIITGRVFHAIAQVKRYTGNVGNKAIQEAYAAKSYYGAGIALVITNSMYTESAYKIARKTGVIALTEKQAIGMLKALQ